MTGSGLEFGLLDESFNEELLAINRACPIEGVFTHLLERGPDFFAWPRQAFEDHIHLGVFEKGRIVGYCMVGFHRSWMERDWTTHAYIADGRVLPEARGRGLLRMLIEGFGEYVIPRASVASGIVIGGNRPAERIVAAWRWPVFPILKIFPFDIVTLPLLRRFPRTDDLRIRHPEPSDAPAVAELIHRAYSGRMLAPYLDEETLTRSWRTGEGLSLENWFLAEKGSRLRGVAAFSDDGNSRETVVLKFPLKSLPLRVVFRTASLFSPSVPHLPAPGAALGRLTLRWPAVEEGDPGVFRALMVAALDRYHGSGYHVLQAAFSREDPLKSALRGLWRHVSPSQIFLAGHKESGPKLTGDEVPFVDMGTF